MPKISELPAISSPIDNTALVPVVQDGATKKATLADIRRSTEQVVLPNLATDPADTASGTTGLFGRTLAGRDMLMFNGSGTTKLLQPGVIGNNIGWFSPSSGTGLGLNIGWNLSSSGTVSHPTQASTNLLTSMRRTQFTSASTAASVAGVRTSATQCWRGNAARLGGFFAYFRFGQTTSIEATRAFVGLTANTGSLSANPSTQTNSIGMAYDDSDTISEGWKLMMCDGSSPATKVTLTGAPRDTTSVFDLYLFALPNGSSITVRIVNVSTDTIVLDDTAYTTDLPTSTSFLCLAAHAQNAAVASAVNIELNRMYCESDV